MNDNRARTMLTSFATMFMLTLGHTAFAQGILQAQNKRVIPSSDEAQLGAPDNGSTVPSDTTLSWYSWGKGWTYAVNLGTTKTPQPAVGAENLPDSGSATTSFTPAGLKLGTQYYWQVVFIDDTGDRINGPVWSFFTGGPQSTFGQQAGLNWQPAGGSQIGGGSNQLYTLKVFGKYDVKDQQSTVLFTASINSNVINAVTTQVSALREYVLSKNGSPLSVSLPLEKVSYSGYVPVPDRQSWIEFTPYFTGRLIPISGNAGNIGGAVTAGATFKVNIEATASRQDVNGTQEWPVTLVLSASPSFAGLIGSSLSSAVFAGTSITGSWTGGVSYEVSLFVTGKNPVSFGLVGTYGPHGFVNSQNGFGVAFSKLFGS